ncbi:MAG TPA: glycolate oxidase subunit GlcE [Paracoccaceae bacterium]|nr:glycolate oxidase subunit GlcE [Paracoccaceae bacterium]
MTTLTPADEAELSSAVAEAVAARTPLEIAGGGTRAGLGRPVQAERTLSTRGLAGIRLYEPGALTLVVGAGTPMAEIEAALATESQMLPFEPNDHRALLGSEGEPTIGGAVAVNASGPRRIQRGACRDSMIGVRFVDGRGQAVANGGRVMKNVTGLDLVKLMAGSYGTLGVVSQIGFKVLPTPEATATVRLHGLDDAQAVAAMADALGSPYDVAGAAHLPDGAGAPVTMIRVEGLAGSVAYRTGELMERLARFRPAGIDTAPESATAWKRVRDAETFAGREGAVWRVSVRPSDGPALVAALREAAQLNAVFYDWGGGLIWLLIAEEGDAGATAIRAQTARLGGHATLVRASAATRAAVDVFEPEPAPLARISAGLRDKFDPHGILNPGRMRA